MSLPGAGACGSASRDVIGPSVRRRLVPDPGGDAGQYDGDGAGWLPIRRLLEARPRVHGHVFRRRGLPGAGLLAVLSLRRRPDPLEARDDAYGPPFAAGSAGEPDL